MRRAAGLVAALWAGSAGAQAPTGPSFELLTYDVPREVACTEGSAALRSGAAPPSALVDVTLRVPPVDRGAPQPVPSRPPPRPTHAFTFSLSADGRVTTVRRTPDPESQYDVADHAAQAAVAAWRFAPGRPMTGCRYQAAPRTTPLAEAGRQQVLALMAENAPGMGADQVRRRAERPGADCTRDRPDPRLLAFPAFDDVAVTPGRREWTWLDYDLDAQGRPVNVAVAASSGNADLDRRSVEAMRASRFEPGARRGCLHSFWRNPDTLAAPPRPELSAFVRPEDDCPNTESRTPRIKMLDGSLIYPPHFRRHEIEGWAIVRFDVAPWGALGPPEIVAAEPAWAFGQAAQNVVRTARADPGPGWRGCLQHIIFQFSDEPHEFERDLRLR